MGKLNNLLLLKPEIRNRLCERSMNGTFSIAKCLPAFRVKIYAKIALRNFCNVVSIVEQKEKQIPKFWVIGIQCTQDNTPKVCIYLSIYGNILYLFNNSMSLIHSILVCPFSIQYGMYSIYSFWVCLSYFFHIMSRIHSLDVCPSVEQRTLCTLTMTISYSRFFQHSGRIPFVYVNYCVSRSKRNFKEEALCNFNALTFIVILESG